VNQRKDIPDFFFRPLEYSQSSISFFLKNIYNHSKYPQYFLALNFLHVGQGVALAPRHEHPRRFIKKVLNLFSMKLQNIYVNPYAFNDFLDNLITHGARHCNGAAEKQSIVDDFTECMASCWTNEFEELKRNPESKLRELAETLYALTQADDNDLSVRELQHEIHYFLSRGLALLIWSPSEQADTWHILRTIASSLEKAAAYSLIDTDMLDDLFWVLLQRYVLFIQIAAPELHVSFFDAARTTLAQDNDPLWTLAERESYIITKKEYLQTALMQAEAVVQLRATGHVVPRFALA
jgi:hypothetical protein